jgi:ABC-2 type transport system permease protein
MLITVRPSIALGLLYLIVPYAYLFFSAVWGLFINIKFPMFDWENDAQVVKQSTAVLLGGLGGMGIAGIASIPYFVFSGVIGELIGLVTSAVFVVVGLLLFNRVKKYELINISN